MDPFCTFSDGLMFDDLLSNMPSTSREQDHPSVDHPSGPTLTNRKLFRKKLSKLFNRIFSN